MKSEDRNTKTSDENNEFDVLVLYEESEQDISSKKKRKTPNKYCEWTKKIFFNKIAGGITLIAVLPIIVNVVGGHISQQRYYDELVGKYIASMEELLIDDKFHVHYLNKESFAKKKDKNEDFKKEEAEYNQVKSLGLSTTENALRSLSRIDGICLFPETYEIEIKMYSRLHLNHKLNHKYSRRKLCIPGTPNNPERQQFLVSFLNQAGLGFKSPVDETIPEEPLQSFLERINLGSLRETKGLNLQEINLSRAILKKASFVEADLRNAFLSDTDLTDASLQDANLSDAFLVKTNLRKAYLINAILYNTNLEQANLIDANFKNVKLDNQTNFKGALYGCSRDENTCFYKNIEDDENEELNKKLKKEAIKVEPGLDLNNLPKKTREVLDELFTSSIEDPTSCASIKKNKNLCALSDTDLSGVDLTGAKLVNADLTKTNFTGADLTGADLTGADLTNANLKDAKGAIINQAKLCNTIRPNGKISDCPKNDS